MSTNRHRSSSAPENVSDSNTVNERPRGRAYSAPENYVARSLSETKRELLETIVAYLQNHPQVTEQTKRQIQELNGNVAESESKGDLVEIIRAFYLGLDDLAEKSEHIDDLKKIFNPLLESLIIEAHTEELMGEQKRYLLITERLDLQKVYERVTELRNKKESYTKRFEEINRSVISVHQIHEDAIKAEGYNHINEINKKYNNLRSDLLSLDAKIKNLIKEAESVKDPVVANKILGEIKLYQIQKEQLIQEKKQLDKEKDNFKAKINLINNYIDAEIEIINNIFTSSKKELEQLKKEIENEFHQIRDELERNLTESVALNNQKIQELLQEIDTLLDILEAEGANSNYTANFKTKISSLIASGKKLKDSFAQNSKLQEELVQSERQRFKNFFSEFDRAFKSLPNLNDNFRLALIREANKFRIENDDIESEFQSFLETSSQLVSVKNRIERELEINRNLQLENLKTSFENAIKRGKDFLHSLIELDIDGPECKSLREELVVGEKALQDMRDNKFWMDTNETEKYYPEIIADSIAKLQVIEKRLKVANAEETEQMLESDGRDVTARWVTPHKQLKFLKVKCDAYQKHLETAKLQPEIVTKKREAVSDLQDILHSSLETSEKFRQFYHATEPERDLVITLSDSRDNIGTKIFKSIANAITGIFNIKVFGVKGKEFVEAVHAVKPADAIPPVSGNSNGPAPAKASVVNGGLFGQRTVQKTLSYQEPLSPENEVLVTNAKIIALEILTTEINSDDPNIGLYRGWLDLLQDLPNSAKPDLAKRMYEHAISILGRVEVETILVQPRVVQNRYLNKFNK